MDLSQQIKDIVSNGLEILEKGLGTTAQSMAIQLAATIVLVLAIRFLFWDKVTAILEKRKNLVAEGLQARDDALAESERIQKENEQLLTKAKQEADQIIASARERSHSEADKIIANAKASANREMKRVQDAIEIEKRNARDSVAKEIVNTAFVLSKKIINQEINEEKHRALVDDFLIKLEEENGPIS